MTSIGINRSSVYALRKELQAKGWAKFTGDHVTELYGFKSPENQTTPAESTEDSHSPKNQTGESRNSDSPVQKIRLISPKNQTEESRNSDSHIRNNQQREPAKEPAKEREPLSGCLPILLDAYRNIAKDQIAQQQLCWQCQQIEGDGATVAQVQDWLKSRRSLSSIRFIRQDFLTWKESQTTKGQNQGDKSNGISRNYESAAERSTRRLVERDYEALAAEFVGRYAEPVSVD